jgi:flagella basal body P-ring formation protein FlgA
MRNAAVIALLLAASPAAADVRNLPVLTVTLYPGDALSPAMLTDKKFSGNDKVFAAYVHRPEQVTGKFARRTLVAGLPIAVAAIKDRDVVLQGQAAMALFEADGLSISTTLLALESGAAGDLIKARNPDSGVTVTAIAQGDGTLRIAAE